MTKMPSSAQEKAREVVKRWQDAMRSTGTAARLDLEDAIAQALVQERKAAFRESRQLVVDEENAGGWCRAGELLEALLHREEGKDRQ